MHPISDIWIYCWIISEELKSNRLKESQVQVKIFAMLFYTKITFYIDYFKKFQMLSHHLNSSIYITLKYKTIISNLSLIKLR
jgi:hypothetical protein